MTNKIEISRELAERLTRYYPAEITGQETMQAIRIEALAALDELRAILAASAVERKSVAVVGMLVDGVVHYFKDEHLVSESGAIVPEADELYRKSSAVERQEPVGFRYRANGDWELMEESPFADGRISHKEGGEELQPLYTSTPAPAVERQGPVAYVLTREDEVCYEADDGVVISNTPGDETDLYKWKPVYFDTSQPAPVAVVLPDERQEPVAWIDGAPSGPWASEWFIAITTHGERVVLRQLPEDYTYDFTTADATYIMRDRIKKWMQFPDSAFVPFSPPAPIAVVIDERAEFEKSVIGKAERFHPDLSKYGIDGEYKHAQLQYAWDLWQARACLDKVKEMNQSAAPGFTTVDVATADADGFSSGRKSLGLLLAPAFRTIEQKGGKCSVKLAFEDSADAWAAYEEIEKASALAVKE